MATIKEQLDQKIKTQQYDEAIKLADSIPENNIMRFFYKARCFMAKQDWNEVVAQTQKGLDLNIPPQQKFPLYGMKAQAHMTLKQFNDAAECFSHAYEIQKDQTDQAVLANYGHALMHSQPQQTEKAIEILKLAISKGEGTPNAFTASGNLSNIYFAQQDYEKALEIFEKLVKMPSQEQGKMLTLWKNKAACETNLKKNEDAKHSFLEAQKLNPNDQDIIKGIATILQNEMISCEKKHDYEKCLQNAEELLKIVPADIDPTEALYCKALSLKGLKRPREQVIQAYQDLLKVSPQHTHAISNLAIEYYAQENFEMAIEFYKKALSIQQDAGYWSNMGQAYLSLKNPNFEQSLDCFNHALKLNPKAVLCLTNRAMLFMKFLKKQDAMTDLRLVSTLIENPENVADLSESQLKYIKSGVHKIMEMENAFEREKKAAQEALAKQNQEDPEIKRIQQELEKIQQEIDAQNAAELAEMQQKEQKTTVKKVSKDEMKQRIQQLLAEAEQSQKKNEEKVEEIKIEQKKEDIKIERIEKKIDELEECIKVIGIDKVAKVKENYAKWRTEYVEGYNYAKAFYWTFINYCDAQKIASTEIINQENGYSVGTTTKVAVKVTQAVLDFGASIPIFGSIFSAINMAVGAVYEEYEKFQDEKKRNAILKVIMKNQDADDKEAWSMLVATAAQLIASRKRKYFEAGRVEKQKSRLDSMLDWVQDKIKAIKDVASGQKVDLYESWGGQEATEDITILLAFIMKNHEEMVTNTSQTLDVTIADIIYLEDGQVSSAFQTMLDMVKKREEIENPKKETERTDSSCACQLI
ncbi:unnamed protein product (macronuclear) [Paramecium tetraurelia]|uniref:Uncharacterized protein n=1 Tax=Paramecium tetraurelia TaxID=5888 RepID=A0E0F3_PARTE|nr:uncharacterized protein GSPATT00021938001 [Paramecium tetraurelia]CAK88770.1 unnamed protein product [Paramecium tetraurelia]|eukprot:XP_001456167.1 hypothetical protein (macronuclear) [Paramecium tetraurelia strain d4-2]